jgi:hypothetical protein
MASTDIIPITAKPIVGETQYATMAQGESIADMLMSLGLNSNGLHIFIDDRIIPADRYNLTYPQIGQRVYICVSLQGGSNGDANKAARSVAMIAVMVAAAAATYGVGAAAFGTPLLASLAGGAVSLGGALLVNALIPIPTVEDSANEAKDVYSVNATRNKIDPYGYIPKTLGTDRVYPKYAAMPYTQVDANDQYVVMQFCLGRGPLRISNAKFGDKDIDDLEKTDVYYGTGANPPQYFDATNIVQDEYNIKFSKKVEDEGNPDAIIETTNGDCSKVIVDLYTPAMYYTPEGSNAKQPIEITLNMKYRANGDSTWLHAILSRGSTWKNWGNGCYSKGDRIMVRSNSGTMKRWSFDYAFPSGEDTYDIRIGIVYQRRYVRTVNNEQQYEVYEYTSEDEVKSSIVDDLYLGNIKSVSYQTPNVPDDIELVTIRAKATDQFNGTPDNVNFLVEAKHPVYTAGYSHDWEFYNSDEGWTLTNGTQILDNKNIIITADDDNYMTGDDGLPIQSGDTSFVSYADTDMTFEITGVTINSSRTETVEIRLRQRNVNSVQAIRLYWKNDNHNFSDSYYVDFTPASIGVFESFAIDMTDPDAGGSDWSDYTVTGLQLKFTCQDMDDAYDIDYIRVRYDDGTEAWKYKVTSLPPWIYADILTGGANHRAISTSSLDADALKSWQTKCSTNGYEFNATVEGKSMLALLDSVCATGRASWDITETGKYSVIYDDDAISTISQVFTPRNSWDYSGSKSFVDMPHCLRISYRDENEDYGVQEIEVYADGYTSSNATKFESMEFLGVTSYTLNYKMARYMYAQAQLRPEVHALKVDPEYLVAKRGERVAFAHDVPLIGGETCSSRIKTISIDGSDVTLTVDDICTFESGTSYAILIRVNAGSPISVAVDNPGAGETQTLTFELAPASSALLAVGNLLTFGEADSHYSDMIIKSITPMGDLCAELQLVSYNSDIYDDETVYGEIPEFNANISVPISLKPPPTIVIDQIISDESALNMQANGVLISQIIVAYHLISAQTTAPADVVECQYKFFDLSVGWTTLNPDTKADAGVVMIPHVMDKEFYLIRLRTRSIYGLYSDWVESEPHQVIGKSSPPADIPNLNAVFFDNEIEFSWPRNTDVDFKEYEVRYLDAGSEFIYDGPNSILKREEWQFGGIPYTFCKSNTLRMAAKWSGLRRWCIKAIDTTGNESEYHAVVDVTINPPQIQDLRVEVVDNNVLFKWTNALGTIQAIKYVEIKKGSTYATAESVGQKQGTFTSIFEQTSGTYTYWVTPVDTAGNEGSHRKITAEVDEPPDFQLNRKWDEGFTDGTATNIYEDSDGTAYAPINTSETVAEHFEANEWETTQDIIDAGYTYACEPVPTTAAYYQEFDYEAVLSTSNVRVQLSFVPYNDGPTIATYIAEKENVGDAWNEVSDNPAQFSSFQYIRDRFAFTSDGTQFATMDYHTVQLDSKTIEETGSATITNATNGVTITFQKSYAIVVDIMATARSSGSGLFPVVDFDGSQANPTEATIYLYDVSDGNRATGDLTYTIKGY